MSMYGIDRVLEQLKVKLKAGMAEKVAELNAEFDDACVLQAPDAASYLSVFDKPTANTLLSYPAVVIRPQPETADPPRIGGEYKVRHDVEVAFIVGPGSQQEQEDRLKRYMRAGKEILGPVDSLDCGETTYVGGGFAREYTVSGGVLRDVALLFCVTVYESP